jgi:hypothetical protein
VVHGGSTITLEAQTSTVNNGWTDTAGATCTQYEGHGGADLTNDIQDNANIVNRNVISTYDVVYACSDIHPYTEDGQGEINESNDIVVDKDGAITSKKVRQVVVVDSYPPACSFDATNLQTVTVEASFPYDGADLAPTCTDNCGFDGKCIAGRTAAAPVVGTNVDVEKVGTYTVTYSIKDASANPSPLIVRTVLVIDSLKPIIGLSFGDPETLVAGSTGGYLGEHNSADGTSHNKYGTEMEKSGYPSRYGSSNPALWRFKHYMAESASSGSYLFAGGLAIVAGVALFSVKTRTPEIADLV